MYTMGLSMTSAQINGDIFGLYAPARGTDDVIDGLFALSRIRHSPNAWGTCILRSIALLLRRAVIDGDEVQTAKYAHAAEAMAQMYLALDYADRNREDW